MQKNFKKFYISVSKQKFSSQKISQKKIKMKVKEYI